MAEALSEQELGAIEARCAHLAAVIARVRRMGPRDRLHVTPEALALWLEELCTADVPRLVGEVRRLRAVCGEAYQLARLLGAPGPALENLLAAAEGRPLPHASLLPPRREPHGLACGHAAVAACAACLEEAQAEIQRLRAVLADIAALGTIRGEAARERARRALEELGGGR
ncbi:MAG TPA: hypothetical protein VFB73_05150 [Chloroflexota bacterium]|nr:hypothetical protein [Chloroflexota bacterium]